MTTRPDDRSGTPADAADSGETESAEPDPVERHVLAEALPPESAATARSRHDAVLGAVPAPLAAGAAVGLLSPVSMALSLMLGSVVAGGIVAWALFFAPPA